MQRIIAETNARSATLPGDKRVHAIIVVAEEPDQPSLFEVPVQRGKTRCGMISGPLSAFIETDDEVTCEGCMNA